MGLRTLTEEYGSIFNGFTSIKNLDNEKILSFNLNDIKEMKDEIVSGVLFNFLLLSWSKINVKGNKMKKLYEKNEIDEDNIEHSLLACFGMKSLALTDHGTMFGSVEFYKECKKQGIKPIIGCEVYVARGSIEVQEKSPNHLILLVRNEEGYKRRQIGRASCRERV